MRFFKIFLVSFFSLIGSVAGVLGIMYATGSFNKKPVNAVSINFEKDEYNVDGDFTIKISTPTEEVNQLKVELSLPNQIESIENGTTYITDGKILIPKYVELDKAFSVEVLKAYNTEIGKEWIIGGTTSITAKSESPIAIPVSAEVNIDVPVDSIIVKTTTNTTEPEAQTTFALNETFLAEVEFLPSLSKYKYGNSSDPTNTKKVFFNTSQNNQGIIAQNESIVNEYQNANVTYKTGFDVLGINNNVIVDAYVFSTSYLEEYYTNLYATENESLINVLLNLTYSKLATKTLSFENRSVSSFEVKTNTNTKYVEFNKVTKITANSNAISNSNLEITIRDNKGQLLQNKIKDVGITAYVKYTATGAYELATVNDIEFVDCETRQEDNITYYMPTMVSSNADNSYWKVVALKENAYFYFKLHIFQNNDTIAVTNTTLSTETGVNAQQWKSQEKILTSLVWNSVSDINLTYIDNADLNKISPAEYDLSKNLTITNPNATYKLTKYLVYTQDTTITNLEDYISNVTYANDAYIIPNVNYHLYELTSPILTVVRSAEISVIAVIIETNYLGQPKVSPNGKYVLSTYSTFGAETGVKSIKVIVNKTIQDISASIYFSNRALLRNAGATVDDVRLTKLAFVENSGNDSIFELRININASGNANIENEVNLFKEAYNAGNIIVEAYNGNTKSNLLIFEQQPRIDTVDLTNIVGNSWYFPIKVYAGSLEGGSDTDLRIRLTYKPTTNTSSVFYVGGDDVEFSDDITNLYYANSDYATIEIYDGLPKSMQFGNYVIDDSTYVNTENTPLIKTTELTSGVQIDNNLFYASSTKLTLKTQDNEDVTERYMLNGEYILKFLDKYDNLVNTNDYKIETTGISNKTLTLNDGAYSSTWTMAPTTTLYITENNEGTLQKVEKNIGMITSTDDWASNFEDITSTYTSNNNTLISLTRYGVNNSIINLKGPSGLIKSQYVLNDITYELCNIISYNLKTNISDYASCLEYNQLESTIRVTKSVGTEIKLVFVADSGLGQSFNIELKIVPNIDASFAISTDTAQIGLSSSLNLHKAFEIYSDNDVEFVISFTTKVRESFNINCLSKGLISHPCEFKGTNSASVTTTEGTSCSETVVIHYNYNELGDQEIVFFTNTQNEFVFNKTLKLFVKPNLKLANAVDGKLEKTITINALNTNMSVINTDDYERIITGKSISSGVKIEIISVNNVEEVYLTTDLTTPITNNLFVVSNDVSIKALPTAKIRGTYLVKLNLVYDETIVSGNVIYLTIKPNIEPDTTNVDYSKYFVNYDNSLTLALQSSTSIAIANIKSLFKNTLEFSINPTIVAGVYEITREGFLVVKALANYYYTPDKSVIVTLENDITQISFPILFTPFDVNYIKYSGNSDATEFVNSDMLYRLNSAYLANNNVYDIYDSGKASSLFRTNYSLTQNEGIYTITNQTANDIYVVIHIKEGINVGYWYKKVSPYKTMVLDEDVSITTFSTSSVEGFTKIMNNASIVANYESSETEFLGVFSSSTDFTPSTFVPQEKSYGLSQQLLELFQEGDAYSLGIYDEKDNVIDESTPLRNFNFNRLTGIITFESAYSDKFAYVRITKGTINVAIYRIMIRANSQLNVYYPYGTNFNKANSTDAEYVYVSDTVSASINFKEAFTINYPNSVYYQNVYRAMLQYGNAEIGFTTASNYILSYSIKDLVFVETSSKSTNLSYINGLGFRIINGVLSIPKTTDSYIITITISATLNQIAMGSTEYVIMVNDYSIDSLTLKNLNGDGSFGTDYAVNSVEIAWNEEFDFSNVGLAKIVTDINNSQRIEKAKDGLLKYYIYSTDGTDLTKYLDIDYTNKNIKIKENITIVKNITTKFVYYTIYGDIKVIDVMFKSNIEESFNTGYKVDSVIVNGNITHYEAYADTPINLQEVFSIVQRVDATTTEHISLLEVDYMYKIDDGEYISGVNLQFQQIKTETENHIITIKILLNAKDSTKYIDDYVFSVNFVVKQSLKSNHINVDDLIAYKLGTNGVIKYTVSELTFEDLIYSYNLNNVAELFSVASNEVLNNYNLSCIANSSYIASCEASKDTNSLKLSFSKSPKADLSVTLTFTLTSTTSTFAISSYAKFNLIPDVKVNVNYPQPNDTKMELEAVYLNRDFVNGTGASTDFVDGLKLDISLNDVGYFNEKRVEFSDYLDQENIVNYDALGGRVKVQIESIGPNLVAKYNALMNTAIIADFNQPIGIQWCSQETIISSAKDSIKFNILIDGVLRESYFITFYADISDIFTLEINYLNNINQPEEYAEVDAELFFIENESTKYLFSNHTKLLSFTSKDINENTTLTAYVDSIADVNCIGKLTFARGTNSYEWLLEGDSEINPDTIIFVKNDDISKPYYMNDTDAYRLFINKDSVSWTERCKIMYLEEIIGNNYIDYDIYKTFIKIGDLASNNSVETFSVQKADSSKFNTVTEVPIMINNSIIGYYKYLLVYDFKVGVTYDNVDQPQQITAGETEISDGFATYGIAGLSGNYSETYFVENKVSFNVKVIMITTPNFATSPVASNVRYYYEGCENYCNEVSDGCTVGVNTTSKNYVVIGTTNVNGIKSNFTLSANGAENNGNIAYLLVEYYPSGTEFKTYKIIRLSIIPGINKHVTLVNDESNPVNTENSEQQRLIVNYYKTENIMTHEISYLIHPITLAVSGSGSSKIFISSDSIDNKNMAVESGDIQSFNYQLVGDIVNYLIITKTSGVNLILSKGTLTANYGNKEGYVLITDNYGFTLKYYIVLNAPSDEALTLAVQGDKIINNIDGDYKVYENTEFQIVDSEEPELLLNESECAIRIDNLDKIGAENINRVTYKIQNASMSYSYYNNDSTSKMYRKFTVPTLPTNSSEIVDLSVVISISKNGIDEVITLTKEVELVKRFIVKAKSDAFVRDNIIFDASDYITVEDRANAGSDLGKVIVSGDTKSLVVASSLIGESIRVNATYNGTIYAETITVGKDAKDKTMVPTNDKYYHKLQTYSNFGALPLNECTLTTANAYSTSLVSFEDDKLVSLITSKLSDDEIINVYVNNGTYKIAIPFTLNISEKQIKSVREVIMSMSDANKELYLVNILAYREDAEAITGADLQKIKNFTIYNDNLSILIKKGMQDQTFTIRVYTNETEYKESICKVGYNYTHVFNVSISDILKQPTLSVGQTYKIQIIYDYLVGDLLSINDYKSLITFADSSCIFIERNSYEASTGVGLYTKTCDSFTTGEIEYNNITKMFEDSINIISADQFNTENYTTMLKHYLVKYSQDERIVKIPVSYSVTPKYYRIDNFGDEQNRTNVVYLNQYDVISTINNNESYKIDFDVWASEFNVVDKSQHVLSSLNAIKDDVVFDIRVNGIGSADFDANFNIITSEGDFTSQNYIEINVKVKVNNDPKELVTLGTVRVQISVDSLYVAVPGVYGVTITAPMNGYTINAEHTFAGNVESIANITQNNINFSSLLKPGDNSQIGFAITSGVVYYPISECEIAVVTVIDGIFSSVYDNGNISVKLKLNENQTSLNKMISLYALGINTSSSQIKQTSTPFTLTVTYESGDYVINCVNSDELKFRKGADGYYTINVNFSDIYQNTFVPTDYYYKIFINGVTSTDLNILYTNYSVRAEYDQTLFFHLAYTDADNTAFARIIGLKYTTETESYGGVYGYSINIEGLNLTNIKNYTVYYLGAYNLNCTDGSAYNLLVKIVQSQEIYYSLARINSYSATQAFFVDDYSEKMKYLSSTGSMVEIYTNSVLSVTSDPTKYIPSVINLNPTAQVNHTYYYSIYSAVKTSMVVNGITTTSPNQLYYDCSGNRDNTFITVRNLSAGNNITDDIAGLFGGNTTITTYWTSKINNTAMIMSKTSITKSTRTVNGVSETYYTFNKPIVLYSGSYVAVDLVESVDNTINISNCVPSTIEAEKMYNFQIVSNDTEIYVGMLGSKLSNFNIISVIESQTTFDSTARIIYQPITNNITAPGVVKYEVKNSVGDIVAIRGINYTELNNYYIATINPLSYSSTTGALATQITSANYTVAVLSGAPYYLTLNINGIKSYHIFYFTTTTSYAFDISGLTNNAQILISYSSTGIPSLNNTDTVSVYVDALPYDAQYYSLSDGTTIKSFGISATETTIDVPLSDFNSNITNLRIYKNNT